MGIFAVPSTMQVKKQSDIRLLELELKLPGLQWLIPK